MLLCFAIMCGALYMKATTNTGNGKVKARKTSHGFARMQKRGRNKTKRL
jgi:hypothetical protein